MGDHFQTIVDLDATAAEASMLAGRALDWLVREGIVRAERTDCVLGARLGNPPGEHWTKAVIQSDWAPTDGLKIETGRTIFHGGQGDAQYATCPQCASRTDFFTEVWEPIEGASEPFDEAFNTWRVTGEATVTCRHCGTASDLRAWAWADDYFAFGYLGFEFWNWPEFDPRFLADFGRGLDGHRLGQAHSCVLVLMGVRLDGTKELIALAEGLRESTESWADLLRDYRRRGMRDPELVVGDGAMGLWKALAEVFPGARHQRCWVHKARNVTNALPKSAQPGATKAMQEIYNAEDRAHAEKAIEAFAKTYGAKFPKAVAKITDDREELLAFYDFPAEHWIHLRTTNPIESTFSTVKLRTKVTRGAGSPAAALAMVFKLVESAQARWRAITGAHLVALVRTGAKFENGVLVERQAAA